MRLQIESLEDRLLLANWSGDVFDTAPGVPLWTNGEIQHVVGDVHVPAGKTLSIQPGTVVQFEANRNLTVDGTLKAAGSSGENIFFTSYRDNSPVNGIDDAGAGDWGAITFNPGSSDNVLDYTEVRYGGYSGSTLLAEVIDRGPLTLTNSVVRDSYNAGLRIAGSAPTVTGSTFQNNLGAAVSMDLGAQPVVSSPTLTNNAVNGVQVDAGTLPGNVTWNNPGIAYRLSGDTTVPAGITLTIGAGQVIKMPYSGSSILTSNGTIKAWGTAGAPIIFTGERDDSAGGDTNNNAAANAPAAGDWYYLQIGSGSVGNVLDHVEVRYGGFGAAGEVVERGGTLTVTNSVLRDSYSAGISMDPASQPTIRGTTLLNNSVNGVQVDAGTLSGNATWNNPSVLYRLSGDVTVPAGVTLQIDAGQAVQLYSSLLVQGTLHALGTAAAPVIFTSVNDASPLGGANTASEGDWNAILFDTGSTGNLMNHTEVRYGGCYDDNFTHGAVIVDGALTLSNSVVRDGKCVGVSVGTSADATLISNVIYFNGTGIEAEAGARLTAVNNTIDDNQYGLILNSPTATLTNNLITNNGKPTGSGARGGNIVVDGPTSLTMRFNDVFNPVPAQFNYSGLDDQTGMNGNLSVDPRYFNAANRQYGLRPGSPVEDAGTSNGAPATDIFGNPRFDDPNVTGRGDGSGYDMGAIEVQQVATSNIDLATFNVNGPTTGTQGMTATINWTVKNVGSGTATGSWTDAVYLSDMPVWTPDATFLKRVQHTGDLAAGQSYDASTDVTLNNLLPGNHYYIVRSNDVNEIFEGLAIANNAGISPSPISFAMPMLTLNTPFNDQFTGSGQSKYYQITVAGGQTLAFALQSSAGSGSTELYVSRGSVPSRSRFDFSGGSALAASQQVVVPTTQPGTYYVLAYAAFGSAANSAYTLTAGQPVFGVQSVSPATVGNSGQVTLTIQGALFTSETQASLIAPDSSVIAARATHFADATHLQATFDLSGKATGTYNVRAVQGAQTATAANALTVSTGVAGHLKVDFIVPGSIRAGSQGTVIVEYTNNGGVDLPAPILNVESDNALLRFPGEANFRGSSLEFLAINFSGPAGVLPPGAHGSIAIDFLATANVTSASFTLIGQNADPNGTPFNWPAAKDMLRPANEPADAWDAVYANFVADAGTTLGQFQALLDRHATYLSTLGEYTFDESRLLALEFQQAGAFGAIDQRYTRGGFGRGVPDPTAISATSDADGNVTIQKGSLVRTFLARSNGSYRGVTGDLAVLTRPGGAYRLQERDGTVTAFRTDGRLDYVQDTNGNRVTAGYSGTQLTSFTNSFGDRTNFTYNGQGLISLITDPVGRTTEFSYDPAGEHLTSVTNARGTVQFSYVTGQGAPSEHALQSITFADGTHEFFTYDNRGRVTKATRDGGAHELNYSYDGSGGITVTDALNQSTTTLLNEFGQLALVQDALGNRTRYFYDSNHNLTRKVGPDGSSESFTLDSQGNPSTSFDARGQRIDASFDAAFNQLQTLRDPLGRMLTFRTDARGNTLSTTYPDGSAEYATYDTHGNVTDSVDRRGNAIRYTYDAHNLLSREDFADGSYAEFTYDAHRNLVAATNANGATTYTYDLVTDRLGQVTYPDGRFLKFSYDGAGRRRQSEDQDGFTITYTYDSLGRLQDLTDDSNNRIASYSYDTVGRLQRKELGNDTFTTYTYYANGLIKNLINHAPDGSVHSQFDYTYDTLGHTLTTASPAGTTTYGYDGLGQLISVLLPGGRMITYQYDAAGNRVAVRDGGTTTNYSTNSLDQYVTVGSASFQYDAAGNLVSRTDAGGKTTYGYDVLGQLVSVTAPTDTFTYLYDALGQRIAATHNGQQTHFLIDPTGYGDVAAAYDGSGTLLAHYTYGVDGLLSQVSAGGAASYYGFDAVGNTAQVTGPAGTVLNRYSYLPFGELVSATGSTPNPFTFSGQSGVSNDGNGLLFMRNRSYDPALGRFTSPDPIGLFGGTFNLLTYVGNNPLSNIDPLGLQVVPVVEDRYSRNIDVDERRKEYEQEMDRRRAEEKEKRKANNPEVSPPAAPSSSERWNWFVTVLVGVGAGTLATWAGVATAPVAVPVGILYALAVGAYKRRQADIVSEKPAAIVESEHLRMLQYCVDLGITDSQECAEKIKDKFGVDVVFPHDPNDISGPLGFGTQHFVTPGQTFPYTILFENQPTATAPALVVKVTQQLDVKLDWTTFELGDFGFGKYIVHVPNGRRFYSTRVDASDTVGEFVDVTADFDPTTGKATWTFTSVDPATGALPEGATDGFLPPDDNTGSGEGFVTYRVRPAAGGATGTEVPAQARVFFDAGLADESFLDTPIFTNTFDDSAPASSVTALPNTTSNSNFQVRWSGSDDNAGSGIASYDIFMSDNGGPYVLWLDDTTNTSDTLSGEVGHTYTFFSIAIDNVGHVEHKSPRAEGATKIVAGPAWQNPSKHEDVNGDTVVSSNDALRVINELNEPKVSGAGGLLPEVGSPPPFLDVTGDGFVAPLDALNVINYLNDHPIGEGEAASWCVEPSVQVVPLLVSVGPNRNDVQENTNQRPGPRVECIHPVQLFNDEIDEPDDPVSESGLRSDDTHSDQLWIKLVDEYFFHDSEHQIFG